MPVRTGGNRLDPGVDSPTEASAGLAEIPVPVGPGDRSLDEDCLLWQRRPSGPGQDWERLRGRTVRGASRQGWAVSPESLCPEGAPASVCPLLESADSDRDRDRHWLLELAPLPADHPADGLRRRFSEDGPRPPARSPSGPEGLRRVSARRRRALGLLECLLGARGLAPRGGAVLPRSACPCRVPCRVARPWTCPCPWRGDRPRRRCRLVLLARLLWVASESGEAARRQDSGRPLNRAESPLPARSPACEEARAGPAPGWPVTER
jgi:hypothetical protein